jgi:2-(1,2-epoxy-1,2-dihydrophenyl)acetyl-CoA isomerase
VTYETLIVDQTDNVAKIRLNRPDSLNSLNTRMRGELLHAIAQAAREARALILTGMGKGFCAGQDLGDARRMGQVNLEQTLTEEYAPLITALAECPIPTIAAVNGPAAGGGANLALAADICVAGRSATFLQAFARIGLMPDCGGTYWLPRRVGMARAMGLAMLAKPITADQAADWGLIWEAVPDGDLQVRAHEIAGQLAKGPTAAFTRMKEALRGSLAHSLAEQLDLEARLQGQLGDSHDFREGVMAFLEKRPAEFRGE